VETRHIQLERFSPMVITAGFAVVMLVGTLAWQTTRPWRKSTGEIRVAVTEQTKNSNNDIRWQRALEEGSVSGGVGGNVLNDPDGLSNIADNVLGTLVGSYVAMKEDGTYTPAQGNRVAETVSSELRANISYRTYGANDVKTDPDLPAGVSAQAGVSLARMLVYRSDLRIALEPLLENQSYELDIFASYIDTGDKTHLVELQRAAEGYHTAIEKVLQVVAPKNALTYQLDILNALSEFEMVLEKMAMYADDPYAAAALLRTFSGAETNILTSFDALAGYFRSYTRT